MNNHPPQIKTAAKSQLVTSIGSIILSFIASSHHWLHMAILFVLGNSTGMMASMSAIVWVRQFMIIATLITTIFSLYRLGKHNQMSPVMKAVTIVSAVISLGFVIYTILKFGW
ncbi:hypothetical protein [Brevibacillus choshinensis]|uniref:hypothetical protein n=1 Tax=Brevibacillus choshinensis TaxID=54911 RepID=UPI002E1CC856|nr:hypothetical protein [Brevibacillus choshinensis]